jgi:DNA-binding MarR family transcriptional regulator
VSSVSALSDHIGYWLRIVSNAVSQDFAGKVAVEGVTVAEWAVIRVLFDAPGTAPSILADRMGMTRGAITKLADRLEAKGLIARAVTGGRGQTLSLTSEGRTSVPVLARLADENDAQHFGVLSESDRQALDRILRTLVEWRGLRSTPVD